LFDYVNYHARSDSTTCEDTSPIRGDLWNSIASPDIRTIANGAFARVCPAYVRNGEIDTKTALAAFI